MSDLKNRLAALGTVSKDTFDLCVDQAAVTLDKQWKVFGRVGENRVKYAQEQIGHMASVCKIPVGSGLGNDAKNR